ncbi:MAG: hypothetical protein QM743_04340 [Chitinophagaceae bacterium]
MSTVTDNPNRRAGRISLLAYCLCAALMAYASLVFYPRWQKAGTESNLAYDTEGYYWYLPSVFIYHNLKSQQYPAGMLHEIQATHNPEFANGYPNEKGDGYILKYTSGMADCIVRHSLPVISWRTSCIIRRTDFHRLIKLLFNCGVCCSDWPDCIFFVG